MSLTRTREPSVVDMEAGRLPVAGHGDEPPPPAMIAHRSGRKYHWPAVLSSAGVLSNGGSLVASGLVLTTGHTALYVAIGFSVASCAVHVIEGIVACILQPRKALEENVAAVGIAGDDVEKQLAALRMQLQAAEKLSGDETALLAEEQAASKAARDDVAARVVDIGRLTLQLQDVNKSLAGAKLLADRWQKATEQLTSQIAELPTAKLHEDMEGLTAQMERLSLTKQSFSVGADQVEASAEAIHETEATWGRMIEQLQQSFHGLTMVSAEKKKLLDEADMRIHSLTDRVEELESIDKRLQDLTPKYEKLLKELDEAKRQLSELAPLIQSEAFQAFLADFAAHKKK